MGHSKYDKIEAINNIYDFKGISNYLYQTFSQTTNDTLLEYAQILQALNTNPIQNNTIVDYENYGIILQILYNVYNNYEIYKNDLPDYDPTLYNIVAQHKLDIIPALDDYYDLSALWAQQQTGLILELDPEIVHTSGFPRTHWKEVNVKINSDGTFSPRSKTTSQTHTRTVSINEKGYTQLLVSGLIGIWRTSSSASRGDPNQNAMAYAANGAVAQLFQGLLEGNSGDVITAEIVAEGYSVAHFNVKDPSPYGTAKLTVKISATLSDGSSWTTSKSVSENASACRAYAIHFTNIPAGTTINSITFTATCTNKAWGPDLPYNKCFCYHTVEYFWLAK